MKEDNKIQIPVWEKLNLTIEEANAYSNIGLTKLRELTAEDSCPFVLWIGTKRIIKRKKFEEYIDKTFSV